MAEQKQRDVELEAIKIILSALSPLEKEIQERVIDYVFKRLGLKPLALSTSFGAETKPEEVLQRAEIVPVEAGARPVILDIRTLKEQKQPSNDREMAAIVGFYLAEIAPKGERKEIIKQEDIQKYFKQAHYELPKHIRMTLPQAKDGGYFDQAGRGQYKLNPVGYNLVVHNLPHRREKATRKKLIPKRIKKKTVRK